MKRWILLSLCVPLAAVPFFLARSAEGTAPARTPQAAQAEGDVRGLVLAVPFALEAPWTHGWRLERPEFRGGWLLVLEVDPTLVRPTESAQPVLCHGAETLERLNHGFESGRVVAVLPSALGADGLPERELGAEPFWFAPPALPESLGARALARQLEQARERGTVATFDAAALRVARARGGAPIAVADRVELDRLAGELILAHAPDERDAAAQRLVPVVR
jgi:hypothetical protein